MLIKFIQFFVSLYTGRFLTLFFAACFWAMQLCQVHYVEPIKQNSQSVYAIEFSGVGWPSTHTLPPVYPKKDAKVKAKLVSQKTQLAQQGQYQRSIEKQVYKPFVYPKQQSLELDLFALKQVVAFSAQQQLQLAIQLNPSPTYRLLKPDLDEYPSYLSLS